MPKIILSRKGFDDATGGGPSPIFPDGKMFSIPIPKQEGQNGEDDYKSIIVKDGLSCDILLKDLFQKKEFRLCHKDPNFEMGVFGQGGAAGKHLENEKVGVGDIFLFFGSFKRVYQDGEKYCWEPMHPVHVIFGYLQIAEIIKGNECENNEKCNGHPHTLNKYDNNLIFIGSKKLEKSEIPGFGVFKYSKNLQLTKPGYLKSYWELPEDLKDVEMTYHDDNSRIEELNLFKSAGRGQEFVIDNEKAYSWAVDLIKKLKQKP